MKDIFNIMEIEGMAFPAGRRTRVLVGDNGMAVGSQFVQGYVVIYPGGCIPVNSHGEEETFTILSGEGTMTLDGKQYPAKVLDVFFVRPHMTHTLVNTGTEDMKVMFVYAPKKIADHWAEEMEHNITQ
ncbi:MAG: cupin domain-containing protein [Candidatus Fimivivens sp.]